jgi:DNA-binding transcriptional MerR regulator
MTERTALIRRPGMPMHTFCYRTGLHPDLVRRYIALGLLSPSGVDAGELWFGPDQVLVAGQIQRLHEGLALNYAAIGLVLDLLERIHRLEARAGSTPPWI